MNLLIATVGLPRSGKSTWAQKSRRQEGAAIVCPDAIRLAIHGQPFIADAEPLVWATAQAMVRALFHAGHDLVILDATNATAERRKMWKGTSLYTTRFKVFSAGEEECITRAVLDGRQDLVPVIHRMAAAFQPLGPSEFEMSGE